jgi:hypothetical protein
MQIQEIMQEAVIMQTNIFSIELKGTIGASTLAFNTKIYAPANATIPRNIS